MGQKVTQELIANFKSCYNCLIIQDLPDLDLAIKRILMGSNPKGFMDSHVIFSKNIQY